MNANMKLYGWMALCASAFIVSACISYTKDNCLDKHNKYYYEVNIEKERDLKIRANKVVVGDSLANVIIVMGNPDYNRKLSRKDGTHDARVLRYYIKKFDENLVNEKMDKYISVYFNENDVVEEIVFSY